MGAVQQTSPFAVTAGGDATCLQITYLVLILTLLNSVRSTGKNTKDSDKNRNFHQNKI